MKAWVGALCLVAIALGFWVGASHFRTATATATATATPSAIAAEMPAASSRPRGPAHKPPAAATVKPDRLATAPHPRNPAERALAPADAKLADEILQAYREKWRVAPFHTLRPQVLRNPLGATVRYQVFQEGVLVLGMEIQVRVDRQGQVRSERNGYLPMEPADLSLNFLSGSALVDKISTRFRAQDPAAATAPELVLYVPPALKVQRPIPAYALAVNRMDRQGAPRPVQALFRAEDGQLLALSAPRAEFE